MHRRVICSPKAAALLQRPLQETRVRVLSRGRVERRPGCARGRRTCHKVIKRPLLEPLAATSRARVPKNLAVSSRNARHNDEIYAARRDRRRAS